MSRLTTGAVLAWGVFAGVDALRATGADVASRTVVACVSAAVASSVVCALRAVAAIWRGPPIVSFAREHAALCGPAHGETVRRAAQLRGTMGGAGHVHPLRLLVPASGWTLAAILGAGGIVDPQAADAARPVVVLTVMALAAAALPPRPFYYREALGGAVVVSPRSTLSRLGVCGDQTADTPAGGIAPLNEEWGERP